MQFHHTLCYVMNKWSSFTIYITMKCLFQYLSSSSHSPGQLADQFLTGQSTQVLNPAPCTPSCVSGLSYWIDLLNGA